MAGPLHERLRRREPQRPARAGVRHPYCVGGSCWGSTRASVAAPTVSMP